MAQHESRGRQREGDSNSPGEDRRDRSTRDNDVDLRNSSASSDSERRTRDDFDYRAEARDRDDSIEPDRENQRAIRIKSRHSNVQEIIDRRSQGHRVDPDRPLQERLERTEDQHGAPLWENAEDWACSQSCSPEDSQRIFETFQEVEDLAASGASDEELEAAIEKAEQRLKAILRSSIRSAMLRQQRGEEFDRTRIEQGADYANDRPFIDYDTKPGGYSPKQFYEDSGASRMFADRQKFLDDIFAARQEAVVSGLDDVAQATRQSQFEKSLLDEIDDFGELV